MSGRVVLLYSQSDHFLIAVEAMRAAHPDASLAVLLPSNRGDLKELLPEGVEAVELPAAGSVFSQGRSVVQQLRAMNAGALCVLYKSPNLRLLAAMSGARSRCWCGEDGKLRALDESLAAVLAALTWQRLRGEAQYAWRWATIRLTRARSAKP